jgi:hypothetical protein
MFCRTCDNGDCIPTMSFSLPLSFQTHALCTFTLSDSCMIWVGNDGSCLLLRLKNIEELRNCFWSETPCSDERGVLRSADSEFEFIFEKVLRLRLSGLFTLFREWILLSRSIQPVGKPWTFLYIRSKNRSWIIRQYPARSVSIAGGRTGFLQILAWATSAGNLSAFLM